MCYLNWLWAFLSPCFTTTHPHPHPHRQHTSPHPHAQMNLWGPAMCHVRSVSASLVSSLLLSRIHSSFCTPCYILLLGVSFSQNNCILSFTMSSLTFRFASFHPSLFNSCFSIHSHLRPLSDIVDYCIHIIIFFKCPNHSFTHSCCLLHPQVIYICSS